MEYVVLHIQKIFQMEVRRLPFLLGIIAISVLVLQTLTLPYRNGPMFLFPDGSLDLLHSNNRVRNGNVPNLFVPNLFAPNSDDSTMVVKLVRTKVLDMGKEPVNHGETIRRKRNLKNEIIVEKNIGADEAFKVDKSRSPVDGELPMEKIAKLENNFLKENVEASKLDSSTERGTEPKVGFSTMDGKSTKSKNDEPVLLQNDSITSNNLAASGRPVIKKYDMPPKSVMPIFEMNRLLIRRRGSYHLVKPQWPSARDRELLSAKLEILNAPVVRNDPELYAPLFRNVSMFKRSYELMERILKVYVYKEGEKPIFHKAELKGIYASEGWFMKLMEGNQKFVVRNPRKAHLFYMPFSTRMLEYSLYVRNSHNRTNLAEYLKNYTNMIAAKYSFWNRTRGTDHFFVACHDWAPYETRHHMERCIKSMCNADVMAGFKIGKDVSLPETYVRSVRNPVKDIGGKPPSGRPILAFFAGSMHGYLRTILLSYWENKDPDMKILGPMPPGVASKMTYIDHMKSSKYCICAKGYNVNSPRVVEAIFYECVPVIISDNFVPPFFEVLNWEAFSVIVAEKDISILKDILLSIPYEKYLALQLGVRKVQRHFVWHTKPMKYDLFSMTLHSIWYSRVFTIKPK